MAKQTEFGVAFRPQTWGEVLGQISAVRSIRRSLKEGRQRAFILTGPSGVGKTTIGRLIAKEVGASKANVLEIDAATHTGVDNVREIQEALRYRPFGSSTRTLILDEAHMLSRAAWNSLLKSVEEPPPGIYWVFCTTEVTKIPQTIVNRCALVHLHPVEDEAIRGLLERVLKRHKRKAAPELLDLILKHADGSPRLALVALGQTLDAPLEEAAEMLSRLGHEGEAVDLCRAMQQGADWTHISKIVRRLEGQNPEAIRMVVLGYFSKVALNASTMRKAERALAVMHAFQHPYPPGNSLSPVLLSLGNLFLA